MLPGKADISSGPPSRWENSGVGAAVRVALTLEAGRNINYLRYADDTTLMAESEEEPKSLLMKVKESRVKKLA